jgi:hypothetical protein
LSALPRLLRETIFAGAMFLPARTIFRKNNISVRAGRAILPHFYFFLLLFYFLSPSLPNFIA